MKKIVPLILGIFALSLLAPLTSALSSLEVTAVDTVAGYGTLLRVSNAPSEADIEIQVEKPDGSEVVIETETDRYGNSKVDLEGFYTKKAGDYNVSARVKNSTGDFGMTDTFVVYPDKVSETRSIIEVDRTTAAANGNDYVKLQATLKDRYGNAVEGHSISIISSRTTDEVVRISSQPYTNSQGGITYHIYSKEAGVSTFAIHDTTSGITLNDRAQIAFYEPNKTVDSIGGYGFTSVLFASTGGAGEVSYLEIEELSESVTLGDTLNFTVTAYDDDGNVVPDYMGEVRFSSSDNNATLPNDYLFEAEDQGSHTFSLSLSFKTAGTQTLSVTDIDDTDIEGEFEVQVSTSGSGSSSSSSSSGSSSSSSNSSNDGLTIYTPTSGTYSDDAITFSGTGTYGWTINIYSGEDKIGGTTVGVEGTFSTKISSLEDGDYVFSLVAVDSDGNTEAASDEMEITIDTTPPEIDKVETDPESEIETDSRFTVTVYSEKELPEVSVLFNNQLFTLSEDILVAGVYSGTVNAPEEIGEYGLDVLMVDDVDNEVSYNDVLLLEIVEKETDTTTEPEETIDTETDTETDSGTDGEVDTEPVEEGFDPGEFTTIEATVGDERITLSWEVPQSEDSELYGAADEIDHYRIYYGPDPDLMYSYDDTWDNSTTWYVDELYNGTTYYFSIVAVDAEGNESLMKSEVVESTPESDEEALLAAAAEEEAAAAAAAQAEAEALAASVEEEETVDTGPEVYALLILSLGFSYLYFRKPRKNALKAPSHSIAILENPYAIRLNDIER